MRMQGSGGARCTLQTRSGSKGMGLGVTSSASSTSRFPGSSRKTARDSCAGEPESRPGEGWTQSFKADGTAQNQLGSRPAGKA